MTGTPMTAPPAHPLATAFLGLAAFTLLFVGAVLVLKWLQKRMGQRLAANGGSAIRIVTRRFVGGQNILLVAEVGGRQYLLSSSKGGVSLIDRLPQDTSDTTPEPQSAARQESGFSRLLKSIIRFQSMPAKTVEEESRP